MNEHRVAGFFMDHGVAYIMLFDSNKKSLGNKYLVAISTSTSG